MDIEGGRRRKAKVMVDSDDLASLYPLDLQMYTSVPLNNINLSEFEEIALHRLQLLRIFERASATLVPLSNEWKECIRADVKKENLSHFNRLLRAGGSTITSEADLQARRADHISHFILLLAYCRSEDLRKWYIAREMELFKFRFTELSAENLKVFLQINNLNYSPISSEEKSEVLPDLISSTSIIPQSKIDTMEFYKVHFAELHTIVRNRKVLLIKGFAYVPPAELVNSIAIKFRLQMSERLTKLFKWLPNIHDNRVDTLLSNMNNTYVGNDYSKKHKNTNNLDTENMDLYAKQHFPMCMRNIHEVFRSQHLLKHFCRLQYGLFIKGIGVSLADAMKYFRDEYKKAIDENVFEKKYAYNIKHMYGQIGSRVDYSPYSCIKIIQTNVAQGEHHGCPFKHWDLNTIKQKLVVYGVSDEGRSAIVDLVSRGHYQVACGKYFEYVHGQESKNAINHPNQYFEDSYNLKNEKPLSNLRSTQKSNPSQEAKETPMEI